MNKGKDCFIQWVVRSKVPSLATRLQWFVDFLYLLLNQSYDIIFSLPSTIGSSAKILPDSASGFIVFMTYKSVQWLTRWTPRKVWEYDDCILFLSTL